MISVDSEIGTLRSVLVHRPGPEIESMTPHTAHRVLYNDIVPLPEVAREHRALVSVLERTTEVLEIERLLVEALGIPEAFGEAVRTVAELFAPSARAADLERLSPGRLASALICGLPKRRDTLASWLDPREFDLPPLPNLYFSRDGGVVYLEQLVVASMASPVRALEARLLKIVATYHPSFRHTEVLLDGAPREGITVEGGDVLLWSPDLLLVGISERTTAAGVDLLARRISASYRRPVTVLAFVLPKERSTIHLDMVLTVVDRATVLVYPPLLERRCVREILRLEVLPDGRSSVRRVSDFVAELGEIDGEVEVIPVGGHHTVAREREQWLSAANFLALSPGCIVGYDLNPFTLESLDAHGFEIVDAERYLRADAEEPTGRCAVVVPGSNLARGGGGVRCMTMPLRRDPLYSAPSRTSRTTV